MFKTVNKIVIEDLNPNTSYKFSVTAMNEDGSASNGKKKPKDVVVLKSIKTAAFSTVQKAKSNKALLTSTSAALTWMPSKALLPTGAAARYEIVWFEGKSKNPSPLPETIKVTIDGTSAVIEGLVANTKYKFALRQIATVDDVDVTSLDKKISVKTMK